MNTLPIQRQVYSAYKRRGGRIALRAFTSVPGPTPQPNPPTIDTPLVDGAVPRGALSLSIRALSANGRLIAGDKLGIGPSTYLVAQPCASRPYAAGSPPGFTAVRLTSGVTAPIADGTAITIGWSADLMTYAMISPFPTMLQDGTLVQARDLRVEVPAYGLPEPQETWRIAFNGKEYAIVDKQAVYIGTDPVKWLLHAR